VARQCLAQRRRDRQQRCDRRERQLPAGLAGRPWVEDQRRRRGEAERVPTVRRPTRQGGHQTRRPHHAGALDRRPGTGQRHVQRDQRQRHDEPQPKTDAEQSSRAEDERREQHHVLAADRQHMREP
jgi:hypothetical protein